MRKKLLRVIAVIISIFVLTCLIYISNIGYFPKNVFGNDFAEKIPYNSYSITSETLKELGEPSLYKRSFFLFEKSFRFTYFPSFGDYFIIRVDFNFNNTGVLYFKVYNRSKNSIDKNIKVELNNNDVDEIEKAIKKTNSWRLKPPSKLNGKVLDGNAWMFEGVENSKYHIVERESGEDKNLQELGRLLCKFTGEDPFSIVHVHEDF